MHDHRPATCYCLAYMWYMYCRYFDPEFGNVSYLGNVAQYRISPTPRGAASLCCQVYRSGGLFCFSIYFPTPIAMVLPFIFFQTDLVHS